MVRTPKGRGWKALSLNQKITVSLAASSVIVAGASLFVSLLTLQTARDNTEIKKAISGLAEVAHQAGRQADAANSQLAEIRNQTGSLALEAQSAQGQLQNAKAQTKAISEQTDAIKITSVATIRSADAQAKAATASERANLPRVALTRMEINGLAADPDKTTGYVPTTLTMEFANNGGGAFTQKLSSWFILIDKELPAHPPDDKTLYHWGGNDFNVAPGKGLQPNTPPQIVIRKEAIDALKKGDLSAFVIGTLNYQDNLGRDGAFCFAYRLVYREGRLTDPFPAGGSQYHCER